MTKHALFPILVTAAFIACKPGSDAVSTADASSDAAPPDAAPTDAPSDASLDGAMACGGGKPATPAMMASMTAVLGGWRFAAIRGTDNTDKPLGDTLCDPSIDYYFSPVGGQPQDPIDAKAITDAACAVANGTPIPVTGGTDVVGYPSCTVLGCVPGSLGMLWDDSVQTGRIYQYDVNKKQGPLIATIRIDQVDAGHLLFIQGATTWTMTGGVFPQCN